jgi:hypothetical protein
MAPPGRIWQRFFGCARNYRVRCTFYMVGDGPGYWVRTKAQNYMHLS